MTQWEVGYKLLTPRYTLEITPYYSLLKNISFELLQEPVSSANPFGLYSAVAPPSETRDYGVEMEGQYSMDDGFAVRGAVTWQDATRVSNWIWTQPNGPGPLSAAVLENLDPGFKAENVPSIMTSLTPLYRKGPFLAQLQWLYMGAREANNVDAFQLPAYQQVNSTLQWTFGSGLAATFIVNNVFNSGGVLEWAPPGDDQLTIPNNEAFTRAVIAAAPNAVFEMLQIPARAYFLKLSYAF